MSRQIGASKRQRYDPEILKIAASLVESKSISLNAAAHQYGIPKSTLYDKVSKRYKTNVTGARTVLSPAEERRIANWCIHMSKIGYGRTRKELVTVVKKILDDAGRVTTFRDNKPGKDWLKGFFRRHPDLSLRTTLQLGKERAVISAEKIQQWYVRSELGGQDILNDPCRLYNADESGFSLCSTGNQVVGYKGAPVVCHYGNSSKSQFTVMAAVSATGHYVPPMIIFPGQRFSYNPLEGFEEAAMGRSDTGWMDAEVFCEWLKTVFIPAIYQRNVKKTVILFIDGHTTHITLDASDICLENEIELYCLLEHASHIMQPLDLCLFASLKSTWKQSVRDWQAENIGDYVTKKTFARVFKKAWEKSTTVDIAVKGFLAAGLFPLDPNSVLKSVKLEPSKMFSQGLTSPETASQFNTSTASYTATLLDQHGTSTTPDSVSDILKNQPQTPADTVFAASQFNTSTASYTATIPDQHDTSTTPDSVSDILKNQLQTPADTVFAASQFNTSTASYTATIPDQHDTSTTPDSVSDILKNQLQTPADTVFAGNEPPKMSFSSAGETQVNLDANTKDAPFKLVSTNPTESHASTIPSTSASLSPFSKHLKYPAFPKITTKAKRAFMPKAITGSAYRKLMLERREKKEKEIQEKQERKQERERKKKEREEEKQRKKMEQIQKKKKREAEKEKRRAHREEMLRTVMQSDSDDSAEITPGICYSCDKAYGNFIRCIKCLRRFHIECVEEEFIADIEFECK